MTTGWWTTPEELDDDQKDIISLNIDNNYLVIGPPGSGKTNLLILRATHMHRSGKPNITILTFNRPLTEFLSSGSQNYEFSPAKIQTYIRWGTQLLLENGIKFERTEDFQETRQKLTNTLLEANLWENPSNVFDCIFLDEAQDYSSNEIDIFNRFSKQIFAVGDANQQIYSDNDALPKLETFCNKQELSYHYRNGLKICRMADGIYNLCDKENGIECTSNYDEVKFPSSVEVFPGITIEEQVKVSITKIETQLKAYPNELIGILCPKKDHVKKVWEYLQLSALKDKAQLMLADDGFDPLSINRPIVVTTIHGAKGLEFRSCHILAMEFISNFRERQKKIAYTGVTRAKTSLSLYHEKALPGYLEAGLAAIKPKPKEPPLDSLFSGT